MKSIWQFLPIAAIAFISLIILRTVISIFQLLFSRRDLIDEYGYPCLLYTSNYGSHRVETRVKVEGANLIVFTNKKEDFTINLKGSKILSSTLFFPTLGKIVFLIGNTKYRLFSPFYINIAKDMQKGTT